MSLGRQFDLHRSSHGGYASDESSTETFSLASPVPEQEGRVDLHGQVTVMHNPTSPLSIQHYNQPMYGRDFRQPPAFGRAYGTAGGVHTGQQELFRESYGSSHPGKSVVEGMFFTKEARAMAMPVLAAAQRSALETHGRSLTPSDDRSAHSERFTQRLAERGAIDPHERTHQNQSEFEPARRAKVRGIGEKQPPEMLAQGKRDARAILRETRRRKPPVQETLF